MSPVARERFTLVETCDLKVMQFYIHINESDPFFAERTCFYLIISFTGSTNIYFKASRFRSCNSTVFPNYLYSQRTLFRMDLGVAYLIFIFFIDIVIATTMEKANQFLAQNRLSEAVEAYSEALQKEPK